MLYYKLPRLVVTLLYKDGAFYNSKQFKQYDYLGDPLNIIQLFNAKNCMEASILNLDAGPIDFEEFQTIASEAFMPMSYGGGVENIDDASKMISFGFEKIVLKDTQRGLTLAKEISKKFGSQAVSICVNYNALENNKRVLSKFFRSKRKEDSLSARLKRIENLPCGEILLQNIAADGTGIGYDADILPSLHGIRTPILLSGGCRGLTDVISLNKKAPWLNFAGSTCYSYRNGGILINYPSQESLEILKNNYK